MILSGRTLSLESVGADVRLLHRELVMLGYAIAEKERDAAAFGVTTREAVLVFQMKAGLDPTAIVNDETAHSLTREVKRLPPDKRSYVVRGRVLGADGLPMPDILVSVVDKDLRSEELLGETRSGADGQWELVYSARQFRRAEKGAADLVVIAKDTEHQTLARSPILFNAPPEATIDVTVPRAKLSEWERMANEIHPLLEGAGVPPAQLTEEDITFLAGETGLDAARIRFWSRAYKVGGRIDIHGAAAVFYGWFREGLPADWDQIIALPRARLQQALQKAVEEAVVPAGAVDRITAIVDSLPSPTRQDVHDVVRAAGLSDTVIAALGRQIDQLDRISDHTLAQLVQNQVLSQKDALAVGLGVSLRRLTNADGAGVAALRAALPSSGTTAVSQAADLTTLDADAWTTALTAAHIGGDVTSTAQLARDIEVDVAASFPQRAFEVRATHVPDNLQQQLADQRFVTELANLHPGLDLSGAIEQSDGPAQAAAAVTSRIGWLQQVFEMNPSVDFLSIDLTPGSSDLASLRLDGLNADAQAKVIADLKAQRRVYSVTGNIATSEKMMRAGYHSASQIAGASEPELVGYGLSQSEAQAVIDQASLVANMTATAWFGIYTLILDGVTPVRVLPTEDNFFKQLPGYAQLFGEQASCRCQSCQSVLSAAAYFVDLMRYIEQNVSFPAGVSADHPLRLKTRRPDLWTLPLTCDNTNTVVPYLDIINEVLESYIKDQNPLLSEITAFYRQLSTADGSLRQPFHLPLLRLDTYLGYFGVSRFQIAKLLDAPSETQVRARLGLSVAEYGIVTALRAGTNAALAVYFGQLFDVGSLASTSLDAAQTRKDLQPFLRATALARADAGPIVTSAFVNDDGSGRAAIQIIAGMSSSASLQDDVERIDGLTLRRLDRINRFLRLRRCLPWTVNELDAVLASLKVSGTATDLNPAALQAIVDMLVAQDAQPLDVDDLLSMSGPLPTVVTQPQRDQASLFDRRFNTEALTRSGGRWPAPGVRYLHPALNVANPGVSLPDASATHRLLSALQTNDRDLVDLITALAAPLGGGGMPANSFELSDVNLALLYRHARAARLLNVTAKDLFSLIRLMPDIAAPSPTDTVKRIRSVGDLNALIAFSAWRQGCGFSLVEIAYIIGGDAPAGTPSPNNVATAIVQAVSAEDSLEFADTAFTAIGLSEAQSRKFVTDNLSTNTVTLAFESVQAPDGYRLASTFDPATNASTLIVDPTLVAPGETAADIQHQAVDLLTRFSAWTVLDARLAAALRIAPDKTAAIVALLKAGMTAAESSAIAGAVSGASAQMPLETLIDRVQRLSALFKDAVFTVDALAFIAANAQTFSVDTALSVATVQRVAAYVQLATAPDHSFTGAGADPDIVALHAAITAGAAATASQLAAALRVDDARVTPLLPAFTTLPANPLDLLATVRTALDFASTLGVAGETLRLAASDDFDGLDRAADGILAAFRVKYAEESAFRQAVEPFDDKLRGRKRDALVDYFKTTWRVPFTSPDALYQYFLLDVELEGCSRTSRIVAANSSLQLYVQRVLMNLEQSADGTVVASFGDITQESVRQQIAEWTWRKHYRVWEANRKVFLYPENYIEPELRDNKSEIFSQLEDTLLQKQISEQNVLDAFAQFLTGFDELSNLTIAGTYLESGDDGGTLHVFGVSSADPPVYYYRTVNGLDTTQPSFGNWERVNVQIPTKSVSLIVYLGRLFAFWAEIVTRSKNDFVGGSSTFYGYLHRLSVSYTALRLDGTWSSPQKLTVHYGDQSVSAARVDTSVLVPDPLFDSSEVETVMVDVGPFSIPVFELSAAAKIPRYDSVPHSEAIEGYTLRGPQWEKVYPSVDGDQLYLTLRNFRMTGRVDVALNVLALSTHSAVPLAGPNRTLGVHAFQLNNNPVKELDEYQDCMSATMALTPFALRSMGLFSDNLLANVAAKDYGSEADQDVRDAYDQLIGAGVFSTTTITTLPNVDETVASAGDATADAFLALDAGRDCYLIHHLSNEDSVYRLHRLTTQISRTLRSHLGLGGIGDLLKTDTQIGLQEPAWLLTEATPTLLATGERNPFAGAYADYLAEIFFHVPFLIANHLNSQQQFDAAQRWYHSIFDPTASDNPAPALPGDAPWRYVGFRNQTAVSLRDMMTDGKALAAYATDPFNPHAIARARPSAYQKSIVMKYIDNLLDWGDQLFAQFTMESVNEATLLYVMASDILGPRPASIGDCGEGDASRRTYEVIGPQLDKTNEFLIELETVVAPSASSGSGQTTVVKPSHRYRASAASSPVAAAASKKNAADAQQLVGLHWNEAAPTYLISTTATALSDVQSGSMAATLSSSKTGGDVVVAGNLGSNGRPKKSRQKHPQYIAQSKLAFCIPGNQDLYAYWDRVEDRLYKIRNCMDISGVRRSLSLFAPEIDPRMLVRMKAAGVSMEDVVGATSGDLPPYRFTYLIDKAKQYAATVQGYGAQLLSALEKRDAEELNALRAVHEQVLLKLRRQALQREIDAAADSAESLRRQKAAAEYRREHYRSLSDTGLTPWERTQQISLHIAGVLEPIGTVLSAASATMHLAPDLGAPTALKFGGKKIGDSLYTWGVTIKGLADVARSISASAQLEATFQRRDEDWRHQAQVADLEANQLEKAITAAEFRQQIAERALEVHDTSIEQAEEVFKLYRDRFSSFGRFTWLSTQLHKLYRMAFNSAYSMANLAEAAYHFERDDDPAAVVLDGSYWDAENAGLLAGERLLMDLQTLERRFVETNYRQLEITQPFSLLQFAPDKLVELRENGTCTFTVPEVFFDLTYPGHYKRIIKAVRLTIPAVVGPYTNVGATLRLNAGRVRREPKTSSTPATVPLRHTVSVAASTGQSDAGVFEFGFRDERYMPFEGAGAVESEWELTLPGRYKPFDYRTISDVILHISYTASEDAAYRTQVEAVNGQLTTMLRTRAPERLFSMRSEFPSAWAKFKDQQPSAIAFAQLSIALDSRHYPFWSQGSLTSVGSATVFAKTAANAVSVAGAADGSGSQDNIGVRVGSLLKGDLTNNKPQSPTGTLTLYLSDNSMDDLWLLVSWLLP